MMAAMTQQGTLLDHLLGPFTDAVLAPVQVTGLALDSRCCEAGDLFFAVGGSRQHGMQFVRDAVARGAAAVAIEGDSAQPELLPELPVPLVVVPRLRHRVGEIAAVFYGEPSRRLHVIGVTGTNGKTSVSHFLAQVLVEKLPCGLIGTLGSGLYGDLSATGHTTPDPIALQRQLATFVDAGAGYAVMEVSSHGLEQGRVNGISFDTAVFTNLSHEHLDYHGDMVGYAAAKHRLFEMPELRHAVINLDDAVGREWWEHLPGTVQRIGYRVGTTERVADIISAQVASTAAGLELEIVSPWGDGHLASRLLGQFNASNLLAALGALLAEGWRFADAITALSAVHTVPGRMESFGGGTQPTIVVDYAHTPDALEQVLKSLRPHCNGALSIVFGCGGDRDRTKRPLMGAAAEQLADRVFLTDDNPRGEASDAIVAEILAGMSGRVSTHTVYDRREAIAAAVATATAGDVVLIAGKGHEDYQIIGDRTISLSDRQIVAELLGGGGHD